MAQYNCTLMGCVSAQTATYPDLQSCQASCVGWGCPPQLTQDTDIFFVYDSSGSYNNPSREGMFLAATAWTQTLVNDGWVGTARHSMANWGSYLGQTIQSVMVNGVLEPISSAFNGNGEDWLAWGLYPYLLYPTPDSSTPLDTPGYTSSVTPAEQQANFFRWSPRANVDVTGATFPTNPQLVISFCHATSSYGVGNYITSPPTNVVGPYATGFKSQYNMWSKLYDIAPSGIMNAFLFPVKTDCAASEGYAWQGLMDTVTQGIAAILKGNQDNVSIGGTGTLDGTFVSYPTGTVMANGDVCNPSGAIGTTSIYDPTTSSYGTFTPWCTTAPNGPATANPCSPISYASGLTSNCSPYYLVDCPDASGNYICTTGTTLFPGPEQICYWDSMSPMWNPTTFATRQVAWQQGGILCGTNPQNLNWVAGQPTWGALEDKGWGINTDLVGANTDFATTLSTSVGVVSVASTICISAETDYNVNPDFSASSLVACNDVCFPSLLPWYCDNGGVNPCYQSALGSYIWPSNAYPTSLSAETDCNANCSMVTAYTCSALGCIVDNNNGQFNSIGECVTACTSYSCTTEGCLGPYQGTGATGTYVEFSSCTATCYHYECVTDNYANSILPNIYNTGITSTDGCVQLSGSVGTSPNLLGFNEYTTFSACTGSCISWGCCDPLGITDNSVMYVYYDITSMNSTQCQNAIKGIIDWTESHPEFTGRVEHLMIWSERWLQYPTIPYTMSFGRFEDYNDSSYPDANGNIVYVSGADFGTTFYGHSAGYWTGVNAPASTLGSLYSSYAVVGLFDTWINPINYTGNATHSIHDSFEPGDNLGNWYNSSLGKFTKGYGDMASASTTDDVINVVFQDESYSMYHGNYYIPNFTGGIGPQPTSYYKLDYSLYKLWHGNVTATTVGNSEGGTSRSLLYPTTSSSGQLNASKNFALHAVAAISSGDLVPQNGIWSATTYPLNNVNAGNGGNPTLWVHEECYYDLPLLATENPYWTGNVPTWGGLDKYSWSINPTFATYNQQVFETDLDGFLQAYTISCSTPCNSASTAPTGTFPYSSETECNPQCVEYNCGDMGCYSAMTGEYNSLSACTAQCESYSCSTDGCGIYNPPTGTTFPITQADGISYYSYYGSGGTFSSNTDCELVCGSWNCSSTGCIPVVGTGGTYSSQTHCELSPCSGYTCTEILGCVPFIGDGSQLTTPLFVSEVLCEQNCGYWECDINLGCISQTGGSTGSIYEFATEQICDVYCASFNCGNNGCTQYPNLSGTYQDITNLPIVSSAACTASCFSYNCTDTGCTEQGGTGGTYDTNQNCLIDCQSYTCTTEGCDVYNAPNYGTGGTFTTNLSCETQCLHWKCVPTGCQSYQGTGVTNSYSSLTQCLDVAFDPVTGVCTTYDCTDTGCIALTGTSGQFDSMSSCTADCTSYVCSGGTYTPKSEGQVQNPPYYGWTNGGCKEYNLSGSSWWTGTGNLGTGGTFQQLWQCNDECKSWDCSFSGCNEVTLGAGSGGTFSTPINCETACTSYNCTNIGCFSQVGSGGTWFNAKNAPDGYTACTGVCISYNCADLGCLPPYNTPNLGSGGTYFSANTTVNPPTSMASSALTACTTACTSYGCYTGGCATFNSPYSTPPGIGYGTGGTYSAMSACTGVCIHWGCINTPSTTISVGTDIYAYYDTTSMGQPAVEDAITGLELWVSGLQNFTGNTYHTMVNDERWLCWATSVYVGAFTSGTSTIIQNPIAMGVHLWANTQLMTNVYDNMVAGQTSSSYPGVTTKGNPPAAAYTDDILVITFIDESGPNSTLGPLVYSNQNTPNPNEIPQFAATNATYPSQVTPTWVADYSAYSATYATVSAGVGSINCFMYPTQPTVWPLGVHQMIFALQVVASIDSGNKTPGLQGENWQSGTAPRRVTSGGIQGSIPELCSIADLTALEISNPYLVDPIGNVGLLDQKGWGYNILFDAYTQADFDNDLTTFLTSSVSGVSSNLTECLSAATSPTTIYPFPSLSACTGDCYSWECTATGCIQFNGTGTTPTYYSLESDCISACTSVNCTNSGCTDQLGTGGTFTNTTNCLTACTSYNCEDITSYTPSASWPIAPGCIEQIGTGGTFFQNAIGSSGSSILSYTACTAQCQSWDCSVDCIAGTTGCTSWPNTGATYSSDSACTGSCVINWYCTEEFVNSTCDSQIILGQPGGVINNGFSVGSPATISTGYGALGWFADNAQNANWSNYSFSLGVGQTLNYTNSLTNSCPGPWIAQNLSSTNLPGYLHTLQSITFNPDANFSPQVTWPKTYTNWSSLISDFLGLGVSVNLGMNATVAMMEITGQNTLWDSLAVTYNITPCICYTVECDVFCDDGVTPIPSNALGPYATSGIAETNCCTQVTWSCITETIIDSCSGKTTLPGQYASNTNAWDWLTVNLPNVNLNTLNYESTTPAINISGACEGPNGGALYDIAPVSYSLLNPSVSYNVWNLFINQAQAHGAIGLLSGMSYSNVNQYLYSQSGQTIQVCEEICHCSTTPCRCIELYDGTGDYLTHDDCISGTTLLPACCPNTGTTGTSWNCTSGITWNPICEDKPYLGHFNDKFAFVDNFRTIDPYGTFGVKKFIKSNYIAANGTSVMVTPWTWNEVWTNLSATSIANGIQWQSCFKEVDIIITSQSFYLPYEYIKTISHPAVSGGLGYTTWNSFYTAASTAFPTLTTSQTAMQVCQEIDSVYWGSNQFGCVVDTMNCCNRGDCYCYELYVTGGTFNTEAPCLSACCPTYTGWTCEHLNAPGTPSTFYTPCYFVSQSSPILLTPTFYDTVANGFDGETECNQWEFCDPTPRGDFWSCVTTDVSTCNPNGNSLGEITGTTSGPAIALNGVQYPFSSSTDQLFPLLPTGLGYLGAYGQVETILTDSTYYSPFLPLSATTFQLGSLDSLGQNVVNPNGTGVINPLPYTLPTETCMGTNFSGGTGMPMFNIMSVSHNYINANTPYYTWDAFITAAIGVGYGALTNTMSVADVGILYPLLFGCSETMLNGLQPPSSYPASSFSGCNWHFEMQPCLCDITCCCETGFTHGFMTEQECLDPLSGCCPEFSSYTCTINGCIDPGNGSGTYTGVTALQDCESVCQEWVCFSSTSIYDSCIDKVAIPPGGGVLPDITEFAPGYLGPYPSGPWDAIDYFADTTNGLQGQTFSDYKWECLGGCGWSTQDCDGPNGAWKYLKDINIFTQGAAGNTYNLLGAPYTDWVSLINGLNSNTMGTPFNLTMSHNDVAQLLYGGIITGPAAPEKYMMAPGVGSCECIPSECECLLTGGTGHTNGYNLNNQQGCEYVCCSGITIPECSILITGQEEGVLYYDFDTNTTTKLFDEPGFEKLDIAARQDKLWIYKEITGTDIIREYNVIWAPFQKVFNRDITCPAGLGRGLTATEDPNILLSATDAVYKLDITVSPATSALQFTLPSGMTCTGDIIYDSTNGGMIITYGTGTTQYVGKFTSTGTLLEESHINLTTAGIGVNEQIDSLFNYGTWTTSAGGGYTYFDAPYNGPIYGITTDRRVIELLTNPLQFAPVATQTLTLVNLITNKVHGASNILNIVNGQMHDCADIDITMIDDDLWWCDELLGCLVYPYNVTPPNSFGPHLTMIDCVANCNFVCGDCAGSCECTLITSPLSSGCNIEPTMAACIIQNQSNTTLLNGGEGCCHCFGCDSVTYYGWSWTQSQWTQYVVTSNVTFGNFAQVWNSSGTYVSGDVVRYTGPNGDECCYTYVNPLVPNSGNDPYQSWTYYQDNYQNNIPQDAGKIYWIPCDEDCPTVITWSCDTGTTRPCPPTDLTSPWYTYQGSTTFCNSDWCTPTATHVDCQCCDGYSQNNTCGLAQDTQAGGLSFTPQIQAIAMGGYTLWNTQFQNLKWDCGSQQYPLPANPCVALIGHWAKILGCRITHIGGVQVNPIQGALKTTWADFIDLLNGALVSGGIYNFPYSDRWQDLEAILGSQSYDGSPVPGNSVDIQCIWEYCECSTLSGPSIPINDSCVNKVDITPNIPVNIPFDVEMDYFTTIGNPQQSGLADPNSGAMFSDSKYERPNWAGSQSPCFGPLGGIFRFRHSIGIIGCRTRHSTQANAILHGGDTNYGQFVDFWNGEGMQGTAYNLNYNDNWSINRQKVEDWCGTGTDTDNGNNSLLGSTSHCQCTYPPNPSYDPCNCVPIYGPGGYPTSAACEAVCCSGETSWSCNTGTTVIWSHSSDCHGRYVDLPGIFTDDNPMSNNSPLGYIANPSNGLQNTLLSSIKFTTSGCTGCAPPSYSFSTPNSTPPCRDSNFDNNMGWAYITQILANSISGVPPIETTNSWYDFIIEVNASPFCTNCVNLSMTLQQVAQVLTSFNNSPAYTMDYKDTWCYCPSTPCECVEISGTTGYPTSASCELICCSGTSMDLWECTGILGCFQTSNGTYASQTLCEDDCQEWECHPAGPCYGNCDTVGVGAPRLELPSTVWGNLTNIMPYFADPLTPPLQHPNLPTIVGNMQNTSIHYYKFDCSTCSLQQTCLSPHGSWFGPASIYVKSLPGQVPVMNYIGSVDTWVGVIDGLNLIGTFGTFNYNTPYTTVTGVLAQNGAEIVVMGESCFGTNGPCDCVLIDGTGHTGTWSLTDYTSCYSSCCQTTDTYDCTVAGCILNTNGTGEFGSYIGCTADCKEWKCVEGNMIQNTCSGDTYLNVDWVNITYSTNYVGAGVAVQSMRVLDYFSNPIHGLQFQNVSDYSYIYEQGVVASGPNDCTRSGAFATSALTNQYPVYTPSYIYTVNNSSNSNNPVFPNATNYNSGTNTCPNPGCMFNTWADFITGCNIVGVMYNSLPMSLNSTNTEARNAIIAHFGLMQKIVLTMSVKKCYCEGTSCNCLEIPGTGHTGNYYTNEPDCLIAANSNPCCTPPDDYWHCQPYTTSPQGGCICKQQSGPGGYPTLADCKADSSNCCDDHTYDCMNQGTPLQGCYGVVAPNVGPYQTMQQCDDDCEKIGYNCKGVDEGPGGSSYVACVPCVGNFCQYTTVTAAGAPYYGDPLLQCQNNCPGEGCWKCCMNKWGAIYQLSPSLSPSQCFCKKGEIEVQCDGDGPCPFPVSCMPGFVYDWSQCKCVCEMSQECPNGWTWSFKECKCIQNDDGPVDFVGPQGKVLQSISEFIHKPVYSIVEEFLNGVELLDYYTKKCWKLDDCTYCADGTEGICVLNGCLYFIDYEKYGTEQVGWKSLLLGDGLAIESPTVPAIDGPTQDVPTIDGPTTEGYSCRVDQNKAPSYTICIHTGSPDYISYFGNMPPLYATLQDCYNDGCESVETPLGSWAPNTDLLLWPEPKENKHSCCPVYNRPGYGPTWISMNLCGTNHLMTGAPVLGVGCGADPTASSGGNDPYWCCEWTIITGSDIELKENIEKVGESESGINIYEFEYKDKSFGEGTFRGVIAQEVPQASTIQEDGYLYVNYSQIDVDFKKVR